VKSDTDPIQGSDVQLDLDHMRAETLRSLPPCDFYEVLAAEGRGKKLSYGFTCHVKARDPDHALSIARATGLAINRQSIARRIGLDTYGRRLRATIPAYNPTRKTSSQLNEYKSATHLIHPRGDGASCQTEGDK
jgi:hypothetical protein